MRFGVFLLLQSPDKRPAQEVYNQALKETQLADELGFDSIFLAEHHFSSYGYIPSPLSLAVKMATLTKTIRIGTAVLVIPLYNPLRLAEDIAMADVLTDGRLDVGVGRGYQHYEFERYGMELEEGRAKYLESLDIILKALDQEVFSHSGEHYQIPETTVFPRPVQKPHPPMWTVVQERPESVRFAVERRYNVILGGALPQVKRFKAVYDEVLQEFNGVGPEYVAISKNTFVTYDEAEARDQAQHSRWHTRVASSLARGAQRIENGRAIAVPRPDEMNDEDFWRDHLLFGTPEQVTDKIRLYEQEVHMNHLNCMFHLGSMDNDRVERSMRLFAEKVIPQFK